MKEVEALMAGRHCPFGRVWDTLVDDLKNNTVGAIAVPRDE
jgi:hypothetical protein